jgi:pimeloyl-ACP methyl ester carboxylesterase
VWRDVAETYNVDPDRTVLSGYSMGGEASNTLGAEHPDAFAGGLVLDGSTFTPIPISNLRWIPYVIDNTIADELDPTTDALNEANQLDALGQRYTLLLHTGGEHLTFAIEDRFDDAVAALGEPTRTRDPAAFSYTWNPVWSQPNAGIQVTGAYWLDDVRARNSTTRLTVAADDQELPSPSVSAVRHVLAPISSPTPGLARSLSWRLGATAAMKPSISLMLQNVGTASINTTLARLRSGKVTVRTDGQTVLGFESLAPGIVITENGHTVARASRRQLTSVRLSAGTTVLVLHRPG